MKIKFTATTGMRAYHSIPVWVDGDEREIGDAEGTRLLADFPMNFVEVVPPPAPEPVVEVKAEPTEELPNKAIGFTTNKRRR